MGTGISKPGVLDHRMVESSQHRRTKPEPQVVEEVFGFEEDLNAERTPIFRAEQSTFSTTAG